MPGKVGMNRNHLRRCAVNSPPSLVTIGRQDMTASAAAPASYGAQREVHERAIDPDQTAGDGVIELGNHAPAQQSIRSAGASVSVQSGRDDHQRLGDRERSSRPRLPS
jgi:hypothetical protein